jgi:hypothetical protein
VLSCIVFALLLASDFQFLGGDLSRGFLFLLP